MVSEITPLVIVTKLEQFDYLGATAIAVVMLATSFVLLLVINALQAWTGRGKEHEDDERRYGRGRLSCVAAYGRATATEPALLRRALIGAPCSPHAVSVRAAGLRFLSALRKGLGVYVAAVFDPDALAAIRLTLLTAAIAVPANLVFGIAAAWAIAKFDFRGKSVLTR